MHDESHKNYPERSTLTTAELDPNSSYSKMLELVSGARTVLDVGCAAGYLARLLTERGCTVTGIDINADSVELAKEYCDRAFVADLDIERLTEFFPDQTFDAIVFGDVLEHLRNPWRVLDDARKLLSYSGHAIASIPNVAHGGVRLGLLKGRFDYSEFGILDNTHLRFFTRRTVEELFVRCGYEIERTEKTILPMFAPTNLVPEFQRTDFDAVLVSTIERDPDFETLQFVVRGRALDDEAKAAQLADRYVHSNAELESTRQALEELTGADGATALADARSMGTEISRIRVDRERFAAKLETADAEINARQAEIVKLTAERENYRKLQQREAELQLAVADIASSIELSVFELDARINGSNLELRLQRFAYDELYIQLASAREIIERSGGSSGASDEIEAACRDLALARENDLTAVWNSSPGRNEPAGGTGAIGTPLGVARRVKRALTKLNAGR